MAERTLKIRLKEEAFTDQFFDEHKVVDPHTWKALRGLTIIKRGNRFRLPDGVKVIVRNLWGDSTFLNEFLADDASFRKYYESVESRKINLIPKGNNALS